MMNEHNIADIPILTSTWSKWFDYKNQIVNYCLANYKKDVVESNVAPNAKKNLWESNFNLLDNEEFLELKQWISQSASTAISKKNNIDLQFIITESWAHVTDYGGYHLPHHHVNSTWSGIFYVRSSCDSSGTNNWYLPYYIEPKVGLEFMYDRFSIQPEEGNLILFPSAIKHDATPYEQQDQRICISFNGVCINAY